MKRVLLVICVLLLSSLVFARPPDTVDVIITWSDGNIKADSHAQARARQDNIIPLLGPESKVTKRYSLLGSISATIPRQALKGLQNNPRIIVQEDRQVTILLDESAALINATDFWNIPANGTGQTVCVIDTGIDYSHSALGSCSITRVSYEGNMDPYALESVHEYDNSSLYSYKVTQPGYENIAVHFSTIDTEKNFDHVQIYGPDNETLLAAYSGVHSDLWSVSVPGDTLHVRLVTDAFVDDWGFAINATLNGTANVTYDWSSCPKVIGGWDFVNSNANPADDNGHGTHVAGIVASDDATYTGVAPGANLIAIKSLNSAGDGTFSDVDVGIEWCLDNAETYNISVISMSLGAYNFTNYCDQYFPTTAALADEAVSRGIALVAASGNNGLKNNISFPSCIENITSVGSVDKTDVVYVSSQSAGILDVLAPGVSITSTLRGGGFFPLTGTSMATPHVAGAMALMQSFKQSENGSVLAPLYMRDVLKATGKMITDSNALSHPRINLTGALASIDDTPRIVSDNKNITSRKNHTYIEIQVSEPLVNATLEIDSQNYSMEGNLSNYTYNLTNRSDGAHPYSIHLKDSTGNLNTYSYTFTVDTTTPNITEMHAMANATYTILYLNTTEPVNATVFYGTAPSTYENNKTSDGYVLGHNITLTSLVPNTTYYYFIQIWDEAGNTNQTKELNFTTQMVDLWAPGWSNTATHPLNNSVYAKEQVYFFNITWNDPRLDKVWIEHNFTGSLLNTTINSSGDTYTFNTSLAAGRYIWRMHANDTWANSNTTDWFGYVVRKRNASLELLLNGTDGNYTSQPYRPIPINGSLIDGETDLSLYIDGTLNGTGKNISLVRDGGEGLLNITLSYIETQNFSAAHITHFLHVNDTLAPKITLYSPLNNTYYSQEIPIIFSVQDPAYCSYGYGFIGEGNETGMGFNFFLLSGTYNDTDIHDSEGSYNYTIACSDDSGKNTTLHITNITVDQTSPVIIINYPNESLYDSSVIEFNITINDSHTDSIWHDRNHVNVTQTDEVFNITFPYPGRQVVYLYANDSSGNIGTQDIILWINETINTSVWNQQKNQSLGLQDIEIKNNGSIVQNVSFQDTVSITFHLENTSLTMHDMLAENITWEAPLTLTESNQSIRDHLLQVGTTPIHFLHANLVEFYHGTYYTTVVLPYNRSAYEDIYHCPTLNSCQKVTTACASYGGQTCYNDTGTSTQVFASSMGTVFGANDTLAPYISITSPQNNSILTKSYQNTLSFSTNEPSACSYSIDSGSAQPVSGTLDFTSAFSIYSNALHTLDVSCNDTNGNMRQEQILFTINDTKSPAFISGPSYTDTTSSATITFTTDEPANYSLAYMDNTLKNTSFALSRSKTLSSLDSGLNFPVIISVCDQIGNCQNVSLTVTTDTEYVPDDDGGGETSSGTLPDTGIVSKTTKQWDGLEEGTHTMAISSSKIAFTRITFSTGSIPSSVRITVYNTTLPTGYASLKNAYQYVKIDKTGLADSDIGEVYIEYRVDRDWIDNNRINATTIELYRYSNGWQKIPSSSSGQDSSFIYYEADSPGMSLFGISAETLPVPVIEQEPEPEQQQVPVTGGTTDNVPRTETPSRSGVSVSKVFLLIIPFIVIGIIAAGVLGFLLYQRDISILQDNQLLQLNTYIQECKGEGIAFEHIKSTLLQAGWPPYIVDLAMYEVHVPHKDMDKLVQYIKTMRKEQKSDQETNEHLIKAGWQQEVIDEAFEKAT